MNQRAPRTLTQRAVLLAGAGFLGLGNSPTQAQNELGDGRGLEIRQSITAPTDRGSRRARFDRDLRFANAIVTGNAPNGLSFRGDLGYTAGAEFRSNLGSNDLFAFRRDTLSSGLGGYGIRGTRALQFQFSLTTGQRSPSGLIGNPAVLRSGTGMTAAMLSDPSIAGVPGAQRIPGTGAARVDPLFASALNLQGSMLGTLRSTSSYIANEAHQPVVLGVLLDSRGTLLGIVASPLDGLHQTPLDEPASPPANRVNTSYDLLVSSLNDLSPTPGDTPERPRPDWEIKLDEIRARLVEPSGDQLADSASDDGSMEDAAGFIRRVGERLGSHPSFLTGSLDPGDAYVLHMAAGERLMGLGSYFDAEERFTRALAAKPDDIAVQIARVHAQLGSGMLRSAHQNLRALLVAHPEIAAQRYGATLLPTQERTTVLASELLANISNDTFARESALLGAYLGFQRDDLEAIEAGLTRLAASGVGTDARLADLLRRVWLAEPAPTPDETGHLDDEVPDDGSDG